MGTESPNSSPPALTAKGSPSRGTARDAGRATEDCSSVNKKADKAAVFAGWRGVFKALRENKIDAVSPELDDPVQSAGSKTPAAEAPASATQTAKAPKDAKEPAAQ